MPEGWEWDETLYLGSAPYYARGRLPYAPGLAAALRAALSLDGHGRLIDVGCGPGTLALTLDHLFAEVVAVDPDVGMLAAGARSAERAGVRNIRWLQSRAENLPDDLGPFQVATFGQSFHWMDRAYVAARMRQVIEPGGAFVLISDVKEPVDQPPGLPNPLPPYEALRALVRRYLGPVPRAGQGLLRFGSPSGEEVVLAVAGYHGGERLRVPASGPLERTEGDLVAWVYSLSGSAPHLFAGRRDQFERDVRRVLRASSSSGLFSEQPPDTEVRIWKTPRGD